jgi:hypothetical protein
MSRFKTGNRIEDAIKYRNKPELEWALAYAQDRLNTASMKQHEQHWRAVLKRIKNTLDVLSNEQS